MIPGAQDILVAYPHKDHILAREVDISFYIGDNCWFSAGRTSDLVNEERGYWACKAVPDKEPGEMAMHIIFFREPDSIPEVLQKLDCITNQDIVRSFAMLSGAIFDEL